MDTLPPLRWQNATKAAAGNRAEELSSFLPQVQKRNHYQCGTSDNQNRRNKARRLDAELAIKYSVCNSAFF